MIAAIVPRGKDPLASATAFGDVWEGSHGSVLRGNRSDGDKKKIQSGHLPARHECDEPTN